MQDVKDASSPLVPWGERGEKKRRKLSFKTLHERKLFKNSCQELQHMPYQKHDTISKVFFSKGSAVGVSIALDSYRSNPCRLHIKTSQKKRTFQVACCRCLHALICAKARDTEQFSHLSCLHSRAATFTSDLSSQHQTQWLMHSGAEKLKYHRSVVEGWVKDDPVTLVACSKGLSHGNYKRTLEIYRVTRETSSGVNRPIAMEWNRTILGKKY